MRLALLLRGLTLFFCLQFISCSSAHVNAPLFHSSKPSKVADLRIQDARLTVQRGPFGSAGGSGVILGFDKEKHLIVLTAFHVVENGTKIGALIRCDGNDYRINMKIVAGSKPKDLGLIRSLSPLHMKCKIPKVAKEIPPIGEEIWTIGNPYAGRATVSRGIITNKNVLNHKGTEIFTIDASIGPGNSGGGVYNDDHELIGILSATYFPGMLNQGIVISLPELFKFMVLAKAYNKFLW